MPAMWWEVAAAAAALLVAAYTTWVGGRVDRCHARAAAGRAALDAHLVRRSAAAIAAAEALADARLRAAALAALEAGAAVPEAGADERETAENDLTRTLRGRLNGGVDAAAASAIADVVAASRRVALARQVHNDLVRDALALRRRRLVRLFRLARRHPTPAYFEIDDPVLELDEPVLDTA
jgi:hypothetical protein